MTAPAESQPGGGAPSPAEPGATAAAADTAPDATSADIDADLLGRTLASRYRLDEVIGAGGMGTVYRAVRLDLGATVAVKVLNASAAQPVTRARFRREARHLGALSHPHSVRLYDVGETDDSAPAGARAFLVMEWVDGVTLSALPRPLALDRLARIGRQVAGAIAEAHEQGMVHRDLKPANVMVAQVDGRDFARVLDFGVAKVLGGSTELTAQGSLVGTPQYMAPEQVRGETAGPAADVYAFGILLYELATGRPPFDGSEPFAIGYKHLHEEPLPPSLARTLPDELEGLILSCLSKSAQERPASMAECRDVLERVERALAAHGAHDAALPARSDAGLDPGRPPARRAGSGGGFWPLALSAAAGAALVTLLWTASATLGPRPGAPSHDPEVSPAVAPATTPAASPTPSASADRAQPAVDPEPAEPDPPAPTAEVPPAPTLPPQQPQPRDEQPRASRRALPSTPDPDEATSVDAVRARTRALLERHTPVGGGAAPAQGLDEP